MRVVFNVRAALPGLAHESTHMILRLDDRVRPIPVSVGHGQEALPILFDHADHVELFSEPAPSGPTLRVLLRLLEKQTLRLMD